MSERLTRRMSDGTAVFAEKSKSFYSAQIYEEAREKNRQILDRLCDLEDKIEQGEILELPCKVGDTFYGIQGKNVFAYCCFGFKYGFRRGTDDYVIYALTVYEMEFIWGEEAFETEEEAEAKVREMKGENDE